MLFLELLLPTAQFSVQIEPSEGHGITRIGRVGDVFEDLAVREGCKILRKEAIVLGLEENISSSSFGGVTENMNSP